LILTLICFITIAGTVYADCPSAEELKVRQPTQSEIGMMVRCATMNIKFQVANDTPVIDYKGKSHFFCCKPCMETFMKDPDAYAK
jgi:YHS domain-containing protein